MFSNEEIVGAPIMAANENFRGKMCIICGEPQGRPLHF